MTRPFETVREKEMRRAYEAGYMDALDHALIDCDRRERDGAVPIWACRYETRQAMAEGKAHAYVKAHKHTSYEPVSAPAGQVPSSGEPAVTDDGYRCADDYEDDGLCIAVDDDTGERMTLQAKLAALLNHASAENESNTPDWILAQYLLGCLAAFNRAVKKRDAFFGIAPEPGVGSLTAGQVPSSGEPQ